MDLTLITRVERAALALGIVATLISLATGDTAIIFGVLVGAAIGWLNFTAVKSLIRRGMSVPEQKGAVLAAFGVKFVILIAVVTVILLLFDLDGTGFIAGFSATVVAVMIVPLLNPLFEGKTPAPRSGEDAAEGRQDGRGT